MESEEKVEKIDEPQAGAATQSVEVPAHNDHPPIVTKHLVGKALIFGVAVALILGGLAYLKLHEKFSKQAEIKSTPKPIVSTSPVDKNALLLQKLTHPTTGEMWLASPKKLPDQGFMRLADDSTVYYEVGKHGTSTILMSVTQQIGDYIILYEKTPDGKVSAIIHPDSQANYKSTQDETNGPTGQFKSTVAINTTTHYDSLSLPTVVSLDKGYRLEKPTYPGLGNLISAKSTATETVLLTYGESKIVKLETPNVVTKLTSISYALKTPINTAIGLMYTPLAKELKDFKWTVGAKPNDSIAAMTYGCGNLSASVTRADGVKDADVQQVGTAPDGTKIYELKSIDAPLVTKAYDEFKVFFKDFQSIDYANISKTEFVNQHAVIFINDNYGQWLVYTREKLRPVGGCAKPVIYLYPQKSEAVSVRVGAQVKVSLPAYNPTSGWNVWANPNGTMTVAGAKYDSLFWEGPGNGSYPAITSGTVVAQSELISTIRQQLTKQGLSPKESADFLAYWTPKLSTKPYVRLTWFDTDQMNGLAPLFISPRPDTLIRVFLDAEGLDQPINLQAQHLSAKSRTGFTVVEWGGLANFPLK